MDCYSCNNECKNKEQGKSIPSISTSTPHGGTEGTQNRYPSVPSSITLGTAPKPLNHGKASPEGK